MHGFVNGAHAALSDFGENLIFAADKSAHSPFVSVGERAAVTRAMRVISGKSRIAGRTPFHTGHPPADVPINIHAHGSNRRVCGAPVPGALSLRAPFAKRWDSTDPKSMASSGRNYY